MPQTLDKQISSLAPQGRNALLPTLQTVQAAEGCISEARAAQVAAALGAPLSEVQGVIEFYSLFTTQPAARRVLRLCNGPACHLRGAADLARQVSNETRATFNGPSPDGQWKVETVPCLGLCEHAPTALTQERGGVERRHLRIDKFRLPEILQGALSPAEPLPAVYGEVRRLTALCGGTRPASLAEYRAHGGMQAAQRWIGERRDPRELIAEVKAAGLVGMGGAAFPTGLKWEGAANAPGAQKFVVINADESEPGTFKDRILMEGDPCRFLEGALLAAYAIGASQGYCYIRGEYAYAAECVRRALAELEDAGYLGENILGSGFSLSIELRLGAGAYICGEETALFESIEGKRGFPRIKPPFPTTHGLFGCPTIINNVETLAKIPHILSEGAAAFRSLGTAKSPGSKLFCLSGDVSQPGLYEMAFGVTLRRLLELAGGVEGDLQAILLGGAAGTFAAPQQLDTPLTFEDLRSAGLSLGSGVVLVFNQRRDLRQVLAGLAHFFAEESCGKCYPCQLGTQRQYEILERLATGQALSGDLDRLQDVGWTMTDSSLCGLGQTAASAVLSAIRHWPDLFSPSIRPQEAAQ